MDAKLIPEQAGFRPGKSCTSQLLNLTEHIEARWLREAPDHRCCLRGLVCCLRHGQPPTPPRIGSRDDWRLTPDRPDTHHAGRQKILRGAEREEALVVGDDNETDYQREVYWHRCCSTSTPTTSPYTPTLAASSTQTTCASRRKETTSTTSKRHSRLP